MVKAGQVSGTCNVQCFQLQNRHMAASTLEKNNSNNNSTDLVTFNDLYKSL